MQCFEFSSCDSGDVEVDTGVYSNLSSSGIFSSMSLDVDEVGIACLSSPGLLVSVFKDF